MEPEPGARPMGLAVNLFLLVLPLILLLAIVALGLSLVATIRAVTLLLSGDFAAARARWERKLGSWIPTMDTTARYNVAYCLHHEGKLEEALEMLRGLTVKRPRALMRGLADGLTGATLILLGRDHDEASARVERGDRPFPMRQSWLWRAHAALSRGDRDRAAELFAEAADKPDPPGFKLGWTSIHVDRPLALASEAFLRGWYHERIGDLEPARSEYARAAATPRESVYVHRAREALDRLAPAPTSDRDEPPSSLSPVALP